MKKLLIFDLDETLIHVKRRLVGEDDGDDSGSDFEPDVEIPVYDPHTEVNITASFSIRPFTKECLEFANKYFEVAVFTAGNEWFASPILDHLDQDGTLFQHRYFRQHACELDDTYGSFLYVKDLDILTGGDVNLEDILIIDNNIYSFAFNLENGIPVHNYMGDKTDNGLIKAMQYLNYIKDFDNLMVENENFYQFR